ncbi:Protein transport protein SFT2 [Spathaspora sp. JA1]|nr:Protein transport protein SFT2 [Spathaspora sp. JA1]
MSVDTENVFRQSFKNWNQRTTSGSSSSQPSGPILSEWTDYVKTGANNLYTKLPTSVQELGTGNATNVEEPGWFKLSRLEKLIGFSCCLAASILCFILCFFMFPVLALRPRKFALLWTGGSVLFVTSFGILQGPYNYIRHLTSRDRIVFTTVFVSSILLTLYSAMVIKSTIATIFSSLVEIFAVLYYTFSYFPFGATTLTFFTSYIMGYLGGLIGGIL